MTSTPRFLTSRSTLGARDLQTSLRFYTEVLGFRVETSHGEPLSFALLHADDTGLALVRSEHPAVAAFAAVYFTVQGVDGLLSRCEAAGATIAVPLTTHPWGHRDFVVKDPDGHLLAIGEADH